ncbi:hypothetical protein F441_04530 [Phytophthora nicotianae CJ01A1]|uniref:Uncharacterized protein n=4 Tax=Phytophthora nicotianae TaxID=4792 RepID=W2ZRL1_PHYNI|nr:hypothetical protein L915_04428 [Phytophthora nicotianae]ETL45540.1 hypothetical protein L916_04398 [Phytophthora nicotianae]ETM51878.1 hypothetical protein L914_04372 [Phytophthora nicotianae]ETP22094.1 hypothetical protein F441_04530 [Phytophthora nicotianae CJ01A1]ETP49992.1 hypothetical protein F442_04600 [Phytophthora nicotianae P10297]
MHGFMRWSPRRSHVTVWNGNLLSVAHSEKKPPHSTAPRYGRRSTCTLPASAHGQPLRMARFTTYLALLALAAVAVTSPVSANDVPDPNKIAQQANQEASTTPESVDNAANTVTDTAAALTDSTNTNTAAAISDSISNVTTETSISASGSESSAGSSNAKQSDSASASAAASGSSASSHVTPSIALASVAAIAITGLFI